MGFKLRRAILKAAANPETVEAVRTLESVPRWRELARANGIQLTEKHRQRLIGICLRGGLLDDAAALQFGEMGERLPPVDAVVLDPQYAGTGGHHHPYDRFYVDLIADAGLTVAFVRPPLEPSTRDDAQDGAAILARIPPDFRLFAVTIEASDLHALNALYGRMFKATLPERRPRLIAVPTASHAFVEGLADYLAATPGESTSLILGLHEPYWAAPRSDNDRREAFRAAFAILRSMAGVKVLVAAETPPIAEGFQLSMGEDWEVVGGPAVTGRSAAPADRIPRGDGKVVVGYAGRSAVERGVGLLPGIVKAAARNGLNIVWKIQVNPRKSPDPVVDEVGAALAPEVAAGNVAFFPRRFAPEEFAELIQSMEIMVLPFDAEYLVRSSGLAPDCLRNGVVMVAPEGSTMACAAEQVGAGYVTFAELTPEAVARALGQAIEKLPELRARSADAMAKVGIGGGNQRIAEFVAAA